MSRSPMFHARLRVGRRPRTPRLGILILLHLSLTTGVAGSARGVPIFDTRVDYQTGISPISVAMADFNGDGRLDLAVANNGSATVSILLGNGDGTVGSKVDYGSGTLFLSIALGDWNGDGHVDLAITDHAPDAVAILLGNGDGTFAANVNYVTGSLPRIIATGDLNGDGHLDLVTANEGSDTVSILLGRGDGSFGTNVDYGTGDNPECVAVGDLNGDGKLDLATANYNSSSVSVLRGRGDGTFEASVEFRTGGLPHFVAMGDMNGDGRLDLATANEDAYLPGYMPGTVSVLLGHGDGTFAGNVECTAGVSPKSVAIGDLNGDGYADLAVANGLSETVSVHLGRGDGTFEWKVEFATGRDPSCVAIGDLSGDGKPELAVANTGSGTVSVWRSVGTIPGTDSGAWSELTASGDPPGALSEHTAIFDPVRNRMVVFGGSAGSDTWALSLSGSPVWSKLNPSGDRPAPRTGHTAIYDPVRDRMVVYGGEGADDVWALTLHGTPAWARLEPMGSPPEAHFEHTAIYDPVRDRMLVFGGQVDYVNFAYLQDVWELTLSDTPVWTRLAAAGIPPYRRGGHTAIYDVVRDRIVVFGGHAWGGAVNGPIDFNDAWELSLAGVPTWSQLFPLGNPPGPGKDATAIYDTARDRMVVFGAGGANTAWALPLSDSPAWGELDPSGAPPAGRSAHSAIYDPARDQMVVFGGTGSAGALGDVWRLTWGQATEPEENAPVVWAPSAITVAEGEPLLVDVAASDPDGDPILELTASPLPSGALFQVDASKEAGHLSWTPNSSQAGVYEITFSASSAARAAPVSGAVLQGSAVTRITVAEVVSGSWTGLAPSGGPAGQREGHAAVLDPLRHRLILFGGTSCDPAWGYPSDVWALDLSGTQGWTPLAPLGSPPPGRIWHTAIYDPIRDRMIVSGGASGGYLSDTWALSLSNPPTWSQLPSGPARDMHTAIFDPIRDRMLVFGGSDGTYRNDVWALSLSANPTWSEIHPSGSPPSARLRSTAIYDPVNDRMILFGGEAWDYTSDVWALNLSGTPAWSELTPPGPTPSARWRHTAIYDPVRQRMVVYGGMEAGTQGLSDAWALNLTGSPRWLPVTPGGPGPSRREAHVAAYDPVSDRMVISMGFVPDHCLGDTWALTWGSGNPPDQRVPEVSAPQAVTGAEGSPLIVSVTASDPDGDVINSLTAAPIPAGGTFTPNATNTAGTFSWTPDYSQAGTYSVVISAQSACRPSGVSIPSVICDTGTATVGITIANTDRPPTLDAISDISLAEGIVVDIPVHAIDTEGDLITLALTAPPFASLVIGSGGPGSINGTVHLAPGYNDAGTYPGNRVRATAAGVSVDALFGIAVTNTNRPPAISAPASVTSFEGSLISFPIFATDPDGDAISLTVADLPIGATFTDNGSGSGSFTWVPGYGQAGSTSVGFLASDSQGASSARHDVTIIVGDLNRAPVAVPGGPYVGVINVPITFNGTGSADPDGSPLSYLWDYGDLATGTGVTPMHSYATGGTFIITLTVSDGFLAGHASTIASIQDVFPARAFTTGGNGTIRLGSGKATWCTEIEPVGGSYLNTSAIPPTITMKYGTGQIFAQAGKVSIGADKDANGVQELTVCFGKTDLRALFAALPKGTNTVTVTLEGDLSTGGKFRATLTVDVVRSGGNLVASLSPNPLNPQATLTFTTSLAGRARVSVFDMQGRLVRTLLDEQTLSPGYHDVTVDGLSDAGARLASGVYFYRLEAAEGMETGQFVIAR